MEYLVPALGIIGGVAALLQIIAPKTKNKVDDKAAALLGKLTGLLSRVIKK